MKNTSYAADTAFALACHYQALRDTRSGASWNHFLRRGHDHFYSTSLKYLVSLYSDCPISCFYKGSGLLALPSKPQTLLQLLPPQRSPALQKVLQKEMDNFPTL